MVNEEFFFDEEKSASLMGKHSSTGSGTGSGGEEDSQQLTSDKDSRRILLSKLFLVFVIVISATGVALFTYFYTSALEQTKFEKQFQDDAQEIIRVSESNAYKAFSTLEDFSRTTTSLAGFGPANESFPMLTIPDFEVRAHDLMKLTKASWVGFVPAVSDENKDAYLNYTMMNQGWTQDALKHAGKGNETYDSIMPMIWSFVRNLDPETNETIPLVIGPSPPSPYRNRQYDDLLDHYPCWQMYPPFTVLSMPLNMWVGFDLVSSSGYYSAMNTSLTLKKATLQELSHNNLFGRETPDGVVASPESIIFQPIFSENDNPNAHVVGFFLVYLPWDVFFTNILSDTEYQVAVHVESSCGEEATFMLDGSHVSTLPPPNENETIALEDKDHEDRLAHLYGGHIDFRREVVSDFATFTRCEGDYCEDSCEFVLHIHPAQDMGDGFHTEVPMLLTIGVLVLFAFTSLVFVIHDLLVQRRNNVVLNNANRQNQIINKLFPSAIHERLLGKKQSEDGGFGGGGSGNKRNSKLTRSMSVVPEGARVKLNSFLSSTTTRPAMSEHEEDCLGESSTIGASSRLQDSLADFFPAATVMFGDIKGFSAWSSVREPTQIFTLLETIYGAFDKLAKKRKVLKVESVKDSYLAVAGVPTPREDHALAMVRFAADCNDEMNRLVQYLEKMLGPDTSALSMRFGLHSGPVTAGVLRGAKARFQLFGDTVNTASRMESTGEPGRIHVSDVTAMLLQEGGKGHWLKQREMCIVAKGKGKLQTYWVTPRSAGVETNSTASGSNATVTPRTSGPIPEQFRPHSCVKLQLDKKLQRIVEWNTEILLRLLKQIVARRRSTPQQGRGSSAPTGIKRKANETVMDEVVEIVKLPKFKASKNQIDPQSIQLEEAVEDQLEDFVANIAALYHSNPFHNYEHASHVTMSVSKMLSRIVAPEIEEPSADLEVKEYEAKLADHTYGITNDPLTQFAVVFSALIHDVDHPGVPNSTLVQEKLPIAAKYKNKSVAEQNSVDLAWELLMRDEYKDLRNCIYATQGELERFRQWVVTAVMSTDIVDKGLKELRNARWERAFSEDRLTSSSSSEDSNRKATIVVEHILQASDISHTMQHWHVYLKWNEKLFKEMYDAYKAGRADKNPADFWYKGEIGFFDFYIIPLAKKLKECGVFGVSSDEYLDYAVANRREWEVRGRDVVERYVQTYVKTTPLLAAQSDSSTLAAVLDDRNLVDDVDC